ncbi:MAG: (d)CMP kinase [Clostridia bacterium]|nr:(d)CMP kinase [Clostridia bacterium]
MSKTVQIAIDGPAGAGKSTISKLLAKELGYVYIDTGAMYRAVGLKVLRCGYSSKDAEAAEQVLKTLDIDIRPSAGAQKVFLDGEDVSELIRTPEVSIAASDVSAIPAVRLAMVELQRNLAASRNVIMDGRDIGTYVLPNADIKIFLTASPEDRALRRYRELIEKNVKADYDEVLNDMLYRDKNDSTRAMAPLCAAPDADIIDTTGNALEKSVEILREHIETRLKNVL